MGNHGLILSSPFSPDDQRLPLTRTVVPTHPAATSLTVSTSILLVVWLIGGVQFTHA
jgi:hypothetical protein